MARGDLSRRGFLGRTGAVGITAAGGIWGAVGASEAWGAETTKGPQLQCDVVVAGGGPAGIGAAVGAAKAGAKVILLEQYGFLGGMATAGLVNPFMSWHAGKKPLIGGVFQEMLDRMKALGGFGLPGMPGSAFDPELFKLAADQIMLDHGVKLVFHAFLCGAELQGTSIRKVLFYSKSGLGSVEAKIFVDGTGDADLAAFSGAPWEQGREEDKLVQPLTTNFNVAGVDEDRMPPGKEINRLYDQAKAEAFVNNPREDVLLFRTTRRGEIHFNTTRVIKVDSTNVLEMTGAELEGRRQVLQMFNFLKERVPGFEKSYIIAIGAQIGVRESRRIVGDYVMTDEDILNARKFEDGIALNNYPIDIHNPAGAGTVLKYVPKGDFYSVPYRALIPRKIENLLVGGRPISTTHVAHSSTRVMPIAVATGHACGVAAALAAAGDGAVRHVDAGKLRHMLADQKAILG